MVFKEIKIKLEDLNENSTPCEICVAMNGREVYKNAERNYREEIKYNDTPCERLRGSGCTDVQKAQMRIAFLNYFEHKKSKPQ